MTAPRATWSTLGAMWGDVANEVLWHELIHAQQAERMQPWSRDEWRRQCNEEHKFSHDDRPCEIEANAEADKYAPQLALVTMLDEDESFRADHARGRHDRMWWKECPDCPEECPWAEPSQSMELVIPPSEPALRELPSQSLYVLEQAGHIASGILDERVT